MAPASKAELMAQFDAVETSVRAEMTPALLASVQRAVSYALQQSHREVTLEHLLLAFLDDRDAAVILEASSVDITALITEVSAHLGRLEDRVQPGAEVQPELGHGVHRIIQSAGAAAQKSRRSSIGSAIVLAAIVGDGRSAAAQMLRNHGLTFDHAIQALKQANAAAAAKPVQQQAAPAPDQSPTGARSSPFGDPSGDMPDAPQRKPATRGAEPKAPANPAPSPGANPRNEAANGEPRLENVQAAHDIIANARERIAAARGVIATRSAATEVHAAADAARPSGESPNVPPPPEEATPAPRPEQARPVDHHDQPDQAKQPPVPTSAPPPPSAQPSPARDSADAAGSSAPQHQFPNVGSRPATPAPADAAPPPPEQPRPPELAAQPNAPAPANAERAPASYPVEHRQPVSSEPRGPIARPSGPASDPRAPFRPSAPPAATDAGSPAGPLHAPRPPAPPPANGAPPPPHAPRPPAPPPADRARPPQAPRQPMTPPSHDHTQPPLRTPHDLVPPQRWARPSEPPVDAPPPMRPPPPQPPAGHGPVVRSAPPRPITADVEPIDPASLAAMIPRRMRFARPTTVEVRAPRDRLEAWSGRHTDNSPQGSQIITKAMAMRLKAPEGGFTIEMVSPETQWSQGSDGPLTDEIVSWRWIVTPTRRGRRPLALKITTRVVARDGLAAARALPEQIVDVRIMPNGVRLISRTAFWTATCAVFVALGYFGADLLSMGAQMLAQVIR